MNGLWIRNTEVIIYIFGQRHEVQSLVTYCITVLLICYQCYTHVHI